MVLKDFDLNRDGTVPPNTTMDWMYGRRGDIFTVNGELNPALSIQRGGLIRLRILNATNAGFYRLKLESHPFYLIGTDGGAIPEPLERDEVFLAPGQRVDLLVRGARDGGSFRLFATPDAGAWMGMGSVGMGMTPVQPGDTRIAAQVFYQGNAERVWSLPDHLVDIPGLPAPVGPSRSFALSQNGMMGRRIAFLINGKSFNPDRIDTVVRLNDVEDWEIINASMMAHPFHLHTNPFQVLDSAGEPERAWRDVVLVEAGDRVRIRVRFSDFPGKAVYHCHIPEHEDLGMMGVIEMQT
jgi:FtsP/CotA-like multicopper oxidase with cupredoxin domain